MSTIFTMNGGLDTIFIYLYVYWTKSADQYEESLHIWQSWTIGQILQIIHCHKSTIRKWMTDQSFKTDLHHICNWDQIEYNNYTPCIQTVHQDLVLQKAIKFIVWGYNFRERSLLRAKLLYTIRVSGDLVPSMAPYCQSTFLNSRICFQREL